MKKASEPKGRPHEVSVDARCGRLPSVNEVLAFLASVPGNATFNLIENRVPFDPSTYTLRATWQEYR